MRITRMFVAVTIVMSCAVVARGQQTSGNAQEQVERDRLRIAVQQICPVSGQKLGEHGAPIKVTVGPEKQEIFVCCKGCLQEKINPQHWATIHANFARAQRICPVMEHELPKNPKWTIIRGQIVYVCCPPCTEKLAADPVKFLRKIDGLYTASLKTSTIRR